jgi:type 1 glutamine amidotransferase
MPRSLLVLSGGHPYDAAAFNALIGRLPDWAVTHLLHPDAEAAVGEGAADAADALLFYDMPGYTFGDGQVTSRPPSDAFRVAIRRRFAAGRGAVMLHHALAGWADWPEWAEIMGGRFLYQPGTVRGRQCLDSGYRHDVAYTAELVADHPVTAGVAATFEVIDELYLAEVFEGDVTPLVRARHSFTAANFYSAAHAVGGRLFENAGWAHPPGSDLVGWTKRAGTANVVYLQFGDGPTAYANPDICRLIANALDWTSRKETT